MNLALRRIAFLLFVLGISGAGKLNANGCTGSWFNVVYSPWCQCWQVCGNYISDCDEIESITWNFGDGSAPYNGGSPCHVYNQTGTYTVTMTIVAYCHGFIFPARTTCNITRTVNVTSVGPILIAGFTSDTTCHGTSTHFTNTSIYPAGSNNTYTWIFGDGTTGSGASPNHLYDSCGAYDVTLIVTNSAPCCALTGSDTITQRVYVDCNPFDESNSLGDNEPYIQESDGLINVVSGTCAGDTTHFSLNLNGPITNVLWTFPDSSTSTSLTPWYIYPSCPPAIPYTIVNLTTNQGCIGLIDSVTGIFCPSNIGLSQTTTLCTGQCSGTATANMSGGGTPPYTYVWSDPQNQTSATATNLCPGPYTVTVTDGNGCSAVPPPVSVQDFPFPFTGTATIQGAALCFGWAGGSAVLNYSGGTPPYSTYWDNGATTPAVTGLTGGPHTVTGTDAHGCIFTTIVNIPEPPPVTGTVTPVNATCGACNGSATVNPTGGHGTYIYRWFTTPQQTTQTATGLCAGIYRVVVEDASVWLCNDTLTVGISETGSTPVTTSAVNALCANICNGQATVNGCGGGCTYIWFDSTGTSIGQFGQTATNLCSGTYTVQATNGSGCRSYATAVVGVPNPIISTATPTTNTCGGNCNGTITASATGGGGSYTYQWYDSGNNPLPGQTNITITNLCSGNYSVRVSDQQGCSVSATATVLTNSMVSNATATSVLCNGDCNGMVTAITSGGRTPYAYLLQNGGGGTVYSGSSNIIANLCAGNYSLIVTDAGNCSLTLPVAINQPPALNPATSVIAPSCFGNCNGTVSVSSGGGTPPYTYEWRNSTSAIIGTGTSVTNLCSGSYVVKVSDANSCVTPFIPVILTQPAALDDTMVIIDPYCTSGQGSIDLTVTGGTGPYSYSWNGGTYITEDISGLSTGTYTVVITDVNSCTLTDAATFNQRPNLSVTVSATLYNGYHFKCAGSNQGEVKVAVSGGQPPYAYLWNDSLNSTIDSIYGLPAGTYTVTVTDALGCVRIDSVALNLIPPPFFVNTTVQHVTCAGANDGSITVTPSGGVPPYNFYWTHDTANWNIQLSGIDSGTYVVFVADANLCLIVDTLVVTEPPPLLLSHTFVGVTCNGANDASIDLTVTGGTLPYTYSWNNGQYFTEDLNGIGSGTYIVDVSDSNGCSRIDTTVIPLVPAMTTGIVKTDVSCFGLSDGTIMLSYSGGTPSHTFDWNNGQYLTQNINGAAAGHYVVVITDANNCTATDSTDITQPPQITGNRQVSVCVGDSFYVGGSYQTTQGVYTDILTAANGCDSTLSTDLSFISQFNTSFSATLCFGQSYLFNGQYYSAAGSYTQTLTASGGCDSVVTLSLSILPDIGVYAVPNQASILLGESITVSIFSNLPTGDIVSYNWSPTGGITCIDTPCSTVVATPQVDTRYTIVVVDNNGCRDTISVPILVSGPVIFIPNVFTPNGDFNNDYFEIFGNKDVIRYIDVKIFDRWGEKVFESNDHNFRWDGKYRGQKLSPAVFVYTIRVVFNDERPEKIYKGSVTLLR